MGDQDGRDDQRLSETLKKVLAAGIGAAFMTEEHIRAYVSDMKLPKDVLNTLLQGANRSKEDLLNRVGGEVIKMISKIDFVEEASRFVEDHKFKVSAEIEVIKKPGENSSSAQRSGIKTKIKTKD